MIPSDEINKIQNDIARLEKLKLDGLMPADLANASIIALRKKFTMQTHFLIIRGYLTTLPMQYFSQLTILIKSRIHSVQCPLNTYKMHCFFWK